MGKLLNTEKLQNWFNTMWKHAEGMSEPSMSIAGAGGCAYRGDNGGKCLVGALIPDEKYCIDFEGKTVWNDLVKDAIGVENSYESEFLRQCQCAHDRHVLEEIEKWKLKMIQELKLIANHYGLSVPQEETNV